MKVLFIGGSGQISSAIVRRLTKEKDYEVWLLNRGNRPAPEGVHQITADVSDEAKVAEMLGEMTFDAVCEFIGFTVDQVERDYRLFKGRTRQYIYTSSASAYHKPAAGYVITEGTALSNPHWQYSRDKIACEEFLMKKYREEGFPVTIVRPSHTYDEKNVPLGVHGKNGFYQVLRRMQAGRPVIIQGDGTSLWHLTFNEDFAVGYAGLIGNRHAIGEAFHITGDKSVSVVFDNAKIKRVSPEMTTHIPFHVGVRRALAYVFAHPEEYREDPEFDAWCDRVIEALENAKKAI